MPGKLLIYTARQAAIISSFAGAPGISPANPLSKNMLKVLYEDNHLIAVEKSAGVLVQGDKTGDVCLMDEVKDYLKKKYQKSGNVFLGLLHRLDRPVSGIVLFAKTSKGASRLSEQFREHQIEKTYNAIVVGKLKENRGVLIDRLQKDIDKKRATISKKSEGKKAELSYKVISSNSKFSLLEIKTQTGRFHQIRAQLAAIGYPVLGDIKYGAPFALPDKSIALSAVSISFQTPTTKEKKEISIAIPAQWHSMLK